MVRKTAPNSALGNRSAAREVVSTGAAGALRAEAFDGLFVPFDAASAHSIELCHPLLDPKRLCENRIPPVRVFKPMCRRRAAYQLRADLGRLAAGEEHVPHVRERRSSQ